MNLVALVGNLATDVEVKETAKGGRVATFTVAINRAGGEADFFKVSTFDRQAEVCELYLSKGNKVAVEGRLVQNKWQAEDGSNRSEVKVTAHRVEFVSGKKEEQEKVDYGSDNDGIPF